MQLKITQEELTELETGHTKCYVFEYEEDRDFVFRKMNKMEFKNFRKISDSKTISEEKKEEQIIDLVMGLCIWPEKEVVKEYCELDGMCETVLIAKYAREVIVKAFKE